MKSIHEKKSLRLLQEMIRTETINGGSNEEEAVSLLVEKFNQFGFNPEIIASPAGRLNVKVTLKGRNDDQPLVLLSHLDVVGVEYEEWTHPPFSGSIKDHVLWGRGTLDTKQLTCMHLEAFLHMADQSDIPARTIHFIASADEENGSAEGMGYLSQAYPEWFRNATVLSEGGGFNGPDLYGEPIMLYAAAEKSSVKLSIQFRGEGGHAGAPPEHQAVTEAARFLNFLSQWSREKGEKSILNYKQSRMSGSHKDMIFIQQLADYTTRPSYHILRIKEQEAWNVIPQLVTLIVELRIPEPAEHLLAVVFKAIEKIPGAQVEVLEKYSGYCSSKSEAVDCFREEAIKLGMRGEWIPFTILGKTDGRFISRLAREIYGVSPLPIPFTEVLDRVHQPDERIETKAYLFGVQWMKNVVQRLAEVEK